MFDTDVELIIRAKNGNKQAMSKLIDDNLGLIWNIVKRFGGRGHEPEDLFQIGCMGFIKAVKRFSPEYDVRLSTYVFPVVMGEIKRFLRDDGLVKVSRSLKELCVKIKEFQSKYTAQNGREPTLEEISKELNMPKEEIIFALDSAKKPESIYEGNNSSDSDDKALNLIDKLSTGNDEQEETVNKIIIKQLISELNQRDKQIIILRYFKSKTQMEVAKILGISQVQVSRLEKKILNNMKLKIAS